LSFSVNKKLKVFPPSPVVVYISACSFDGDRKRDFGTPFPPASPAPLLSLSGRARLLGLRYFHVPPSADIPFFFPKNGRPVCLYPPRPENPPFFFFFFHRKPKIFLERKRNCHSPPSNSMSSRFSLLHKPCADPPNSTKPPSGQYPRSPWKKKRPPFPSIN